MVARFVEKKGLLDGLKGCAMALQKGMDLELTIVGDCGRDDPAGQEIRQSLHQFVAQHSLQNQVHFAGFQPYAETRRLLASHDVFLCPSRHAKDGDAEGGSPVVLTEAMALGLVCIGSRHCDIPEVILDGKTGFLCGDGNAEAVAEALLQLLPQKNALPTILSAGRRHIEENFNLTRQLDTLRAIYTSLAGAAKSAQP
jgi:colanic acid/amylovoran biosynthesis glycosyltransferase